MDQRGQDNWRMADCSGAKAPRSKEFGCSSEWTQSWVKKQSALTGFDVRVAGTIVKYAQIRNRRAITAV
jgi:hypothetical protein